MTVKLAHICIETTDLKKTEAFYRLLGLSRRFDFRNHDDELVAFYLSFDDQTFIEVIQIGEPKCKGVIAHFAIEVSDIDAIRSKLVSNDVEVSEKELGIDHTWMITCHDPNGIYIELQQYTEASLQTVGGVCKVDYKPGVTPRD